MKKIELDYVRCNICQTDDSSLFCKISADTGWNFDPQEFSYMRCNNCKLLYLNPRPKEDDLFEYYNQETIQTDRKVKGHVSAYFHNYISGKNSHIENALLELKKINKNRSGGRLLEVGCAAGFFLNEARSMGWDVYGIEPSQNFVNYAIDTLDLNVKLGTLEKNQFPDNYFDAVVHFDLISHLTSPKNTFEIIHRILKPNGFHYFRTGNKAELTKKSQGEKGEVWGVPEHLFHFSRENTRLLLENTGFETKKIIASANLTRMLFFKKEEKDSQNKPNNSNNNPIESIASKSNENLLKRILHSPTVFPLYKFLRENRLLWKNLGRLATIIIKPISATIWVYSYKK